MDDFSAAVFDVVLDKDTRWECGRIHSEDVLPRVVEKDQACFVGVWQISVG